MISTGVTPRMFISHDRSVPAVPLQRLVHTHVAGGVARRRHIPEKRGDEGRAKGGVGEGGCGAGSAR